MRAVGLAMIFLLGGCGGDTATLVVSLKTNLVPGAEFTGVGVRVGGVQRQFVARREHDFIVGLRVAEISGLDVDPSTHIDVELVTAEGVVVTRPLIVDLSPLNVAVTIVVGDGTTTSSSIPVLVSGL